MTTENLFTERQHFKQVWLWALLIAINGFFIYGWASQVFGGRTLGDRPISNALLTLATFTVVVLTVSSLFMRLDTTIRQDGIYYRFLPFQWSYRKITWDRISKAFVRKYSPILEYGGWGLRIGLFGRGKAFNVSGSQGLQLVYHNGKKFLLGTQRPEEIERVLKQLGRLTTEGS